MSLSKQKIKLINSLKIKKYRNKENLFVCEGKKIFQALVESDFQICEIFATKDFIVDNKDFFDNCEYTELTETELRKISSLSTPQKVLAVVKMPEKELQYEEINENLTLVLDKIQDPGNLGTIIRIADWFGIKNIICSSDTVDVYNPKTVQSTMGSLFGVKIFYTELKHFFDKISDKISVYGTYMRAESIYTSELDKNAVIILGNEANGISQQISKFVTKKISIPSFNQNKTAESLNVAIATAIICSEFKRR